MSLRGPTGVGRHRLLGQRLTSSQVFWLTLTARSTVSIALLPLLTASRAGRDGWLAFLASLPPGLGLAWIMAYLSGLLPGAGLAEQARWALGRAGGALVAMLYVWSYVHFTSLIVRDYAEVIVAAVLPTTPLAVVVTAVSLLAGVIAAHDTPTMGRLALILGPVVVMAILGILLLVAPQADPARLKPVFETGWRGIASGLLESTSWHSMVLFYPAIAPSLADPKRGRRAFLAGMTAATLLGAFLSALVVSVLSAELAVQAEFPLFVVARLVMIGEFVQRIDALAIGAWGLGLLVGASLFLHAAVLSLSNLVGVTDHRRFAKPVALLVVIGAMTVAADTPELRQFTDVRVLAPYVMGHLWVPTAVWAIAAWLRGRAARSALQAG